MRLFVVSLLILSAAGPAFSQGDAGNPDTVRLHDTAFAAGQAAIAVTVVNDQPLSGLQIPLAFSTDLVVLDSIAWGPRVTTVDDDIARWDANPGGTQQTVIIAVVPLSSGSIAIGDDAIATLHFSRDTASTASTAVISDTSLTPAGGLILADTADSPQGYRPQFIGGEVSATVGVFEAGGTLPQSFELRPNYPNPFNPSTSFAVALPEPRHVVVDIFNLLGQRVVRLFDGPAAAGYLELSWNGRDGRGQPAGSGVYFYRVSAGDFTGVRKMILLK
jgi:hypothetical protein